MDDMWDMAAWNGLKIAFPDDNNGIRILITTRRDLPLTVKSMECISFLMMKVGCY